MDTNYIIETKNLTKQYGSQKSVADLNIHVKRGRIYGLLGRNGAGKTTTMKMLLGLTKPTSGEVKIWGKSLQGNEKKLLPRIGSLIESPGFYPNLTGTENLRIFATLRGVPNNHAIKDALDLVGLPYKDKKLFIIRFKRKEKKMKTTLLIMTAGIGSRFGTGIKQLEPVDDAGHIIMDYSIHDAIEAGFNHVVFIIRKDIEKEFKEVIGDRIDSICSSHNVTVDYAFQDINDIPGTLPEGRTKPWGTGQAVLAAKNVIDTPFIVINADDYYGKTAFKLIHDYLVSDKADSGKYEFCMAGFILGNTLSDNGDVTRGVCVMDKGGHLTGVNETGGIVKTADGAAAEDKDGNVVVINPASHVSMNMWGFTPDFLDELEKGFKEFLGGLKDGDIKSEYLLPSVVDQLIKDGKANVSVLETNDKWFGVTYKEDKPVVVESIRKLISEGKYPEKLYN